jgi:hypothetical protein
MANLPHHYTIDVDAVRLSCYRLYCLFAANREISQNSDPHNPIEPVTRLEAKFLPLEMTKLLIDVAISLRLLDDQMRSKAEDKPCRGAYTRALGTINSEFQSVCVFSDPPLKVREVCNKIIHAERVQPHLHTVADGTHRYDEFAAIAESDNIEELLNSFATAPELVQWRYYSGLVLLSGSDKKDGEWQHLLDVREFVKVVFLFLERAFPT